MKVAQRFAAAVGAALLASCVTLTREPRGVMPAADGAVRVAPIGCALNAPAADLRVPSTAAALDPQQIRLLTWNVHKQGDAGWDRDLARFAAGADVVLLQEAVLRQGLRPLLEAQGLDWVMASSFQYEDADFGVLTAARVPALASCAERAVEPLLGIPKSGLISWFALGGAGSVLAVVNVHAINFSLALPAYEAQFAALAAALAHHRGPIVFAGDFNTWSRDRLAVVQTIAARLGLVEVVFPDGVRARFLGHEVDHVLVRGLDAVAATAIRVDSSDHNPVQVTLRVGPAR